MYTSESCFVLMLGKKDKHQGLLYTIQTKKQPLHTSLIPSELYRREEEIADSLAKVI